MLEVASPVAMNLYQDIIGAKGGIPDLADRLDMAHMTAILFRIALVFLL